MQKEDLKQYFSNPLILFLFIVSTIFFLLQHYLHLSWDFSAYVLNARHLFYNGSYFEVYRAPLASLFLGVFLFLGKLGEFLYVFFVSLLFFYSILCLSDSLHNKYFNKYNLNKRILAFLVYLFLLSPFVLNYGLLIGTELLGLSFFILFLANFFEDRISGHYLSLAFLSRYNFLLFIPFLFFNKSFSKILKNILLFFLVSLPWFLFNFFRYGNWFQSIIDSYYLNVLARQSMVEPFSISHLFPVIGWILPLFFLGVLYFLIRLYKNRFKVSKFKTELVFILIFGLILFDFYNTPFKITRYLFNLSLPIAFFSVVGTIVLFKRFKKFQEILIIIFLIAFILPIPFLMYHNYLRNEAQIVYRQSTIDISDLGLGDCLVLSSHWVPINYYHESSYLPAYGIKTAIENNEIMLVFTKYPTMDDSYSEEEFGSYPMLLNNSDYILFGKEDLNNQTCKKWTKYEKIFVPDVCKTISQRFGILESPMLKICRLINFKSNLD